MITHDECKAKAEKYVRRNLSVNERDSVLAIVNRSYIEGFLQGYSCAGGIMDAAEIAERDSK